MIQTITVPYMLGITVNCYLLTTTDGFILVDTGGANQRPAIEGALKTAGVTRDNLRLIVLTHGDFDHCGNAAHLSRMYQAPTAVHTDDWGMVLHGDMTWNRKQPNIIMLALLRRVMSLKPADRFQPDVALKAGDTLADYGLDARIIELPGHSKGSIGILLPSGELLCGDLLANRKTPDFWMIIDDQPTANASLAKLRGLPITTVYPGHGKPFDIKQLWERYP